MLHFGPTLFADNEKFLRVLCEVIKMMHLPRNSPLACADVSCRKIFWSLLRIICLLLGQAPRASRYWYLHDVSHITELRLWEGIWGVKFRPSKTPRYLLLQENWWPLKIEVKNWRHVVTLAKCWWMSNRFDLVILAPSKQIQEGKMSHLVSHLFL